MAEERTRRQEEKAAKEMAAQERRKALEAERQVKQKKEWMKKRGNSIKLFYIMCVKELVFQVTIGN